MSNVVDVAVIGCGVAGTFIVHKLSKEHKNLKILCIDTGRPPQKRRLQLCGFLGSLPFSDGKFYQNDLSKVSDLTSSKKTKVANAYFNKVISNIRDFNLIKDTAPKALIEKKIKKLGYKITTNNHLQMYPKDIHALSKYISNGLEHNKNITFSFDNEVQQIHKQKKIFVISTEMGEFHCKKLIIAVGRAGWRWAKKLYSDFGLIDSNDVAKFGIRVEMNAELLKDFNQSNCSLIKSDVEIGPFSWLGTVIPEDHQDMAISNFRSNETRWETDKVSFSIIGNRPFINQGIEQIDRIGQLTFILANERVIKERVSYILSGKSKISILSEYDWLKDILKDLSTVVPEITTKAYFHVPTIMPVIPMINIGNNLETELDDMYVVGESAGIHGLLSAATSGIICADEVMK